MTSSLHRRILESAIKATPSFIAHIITPALLTLVDPLIALAATICYIYYQELDIRLGENPHETQIDIVEWILGLALGLTLRVILVQLHITLPP